MPNKTDGSVVSPNEGQNLLRRPEDYSRASSFPRLFSPYLSGTRTATRIAGKTSQTLKAYLESYRAGVAGQMEQVRGIVTGTIEGEVGIDGMHTIGIWMVC